MKLNTLTISNFQAISDVTLNFDAAPITLIAALNEQGKTSIADAISMAFTGRSTRVDLKKDYGQLVRAGTKRGFIALDWDSGKARVTLPAGTLANEGEPAPRSINLLLNGNRFTSLSPDERRVFLFELLKASLGDDVLTKRLLAKGHLAATIAAAKISDGAAVAHKQAKAMASEARGAWKAITGEAYGDNKGANWAPPEITIDPDALAQAHADLTALTQTLNGLREAEGARKVRAEEDAKLARHRTGLRDCAAQHGRLTAKLETDESNLIPAAVALEAARVAAGLVPKRAAPGNVVNLIELVRRLLDLSATSQIISTLSGEVMAWDSALVERMTAALAAHRAEYGNGPPDAETLALAAKLGEREAAHRLMQSAVSNTRRDLAAAELAAKALAELPAEVASDLGAADTGASEIVALTDKQSTLRATIHALEVQAGSVAARAHKIDQARAQHANVVAWEALAEDLAPSGIPGEILRDAIKPFNARLQGTANMTGWETVAITPDMDVVVNGRGYRLESASKRWLIDVQIAEAIAHFSGLKLLIADEMDILDLERRGSFMTWVDDLVAAGELDTVVILATLKALPANLPDNWASHWLEDGALYDQITLAA